MPSLLHPEIKPGRHLFLPEHMEFFIRFLPGDLVEMESTGKGLHFALYDTGDKTGYAGYVEFPTYAGNSNHISPMNVPLNLHDLELLLVQEFEGQGWYHKRQAPIQFFGFGNRLLNVESADVPPTSEMKEHLLEGGMGSVLHTGVPKTVHNMGLGRQKMLEGYLRQWAFDDLELDLEPEYIGPLSDTSSGAYHVFFEATSGEFWVEHQPFTAEEWEKAAADMRQKKPWLQRKLTQLRWDVQPTVEKYANRILQRTGHRTRPPIGSPKIIS